MFSIDMQVWTPEDRDADNNRRFGNFTYDLHLIRSWLKVCDKKIESIAKECLCEIDVKEPEKQ
ncbi:MAG: hypothetical protein LBI60_02580 [Bacteroidales bacterium]|jgi:hypothetical protein|nr:hypothetical protein [Bacteroidales bacterium]